MKKAKANALWWVDDTLDPARLTRRIAKGANVDKPVELPGSLTPTPLGIAAATANIASARVLLAAGADPDNAGELQGSPLSQIIAQSDIRGISLEQVREFCALLLSYGANPNGYAKAGGTPSAACLPIYVATKQKDPVLVNMLAEAGADVDRIAILRNHGGSEQRVTALLNAKRSGDQQMMLTLLQLGANDECMAGDAIGGLTPFKTCVLNGRDILVDYYVRGRGESLDQRIDGKDLVSATPFTSTKQLLGALRTELAIQKGFGHQMDNEHAKSTNGTLKGMSPL